INIHPEGCCSNAILLLPGVRSIEKRWREVPFTPLPAGGVRDLVNPLTLQYWEVVLLQVLPTTAGQSWVRMVLGGYFNYPDVEISHRGWNNPPQEPLYLSLNLKRTCVSHTAKFSESCHRRV